MNRPISAAMIAAIIFAGAAHALPPTKSPAKPAVRAAATPAVKAPGALRDWTKVATDTPAGNVVLGNPRARVKVIEYLSFTCSHCAAFSVESGPVLKEQFIRSGSLSIEYRPIGRDFPDLGATILARCAGGLGFANAADEIFARQPEWLSLAMGFMERDAKRFVLDTPLGQIRAGAQANGLIDLMVARGLSRQRIDACFANEKLLASILANGEAARKVIKGTPAIVINGTMVKEFTWAGVEPLLRAGGAR